MQNRPQRPQVLIVGAGFGGLEATKALARADVDVTLVDAYNHHCFQPLLYQVATAALSPADVAWPIRAIMRKQKNVRVIMARVTGIDVAARRVHTSELDLSYDYLVLATGSTHSYFGRDDWEPFAPGLKHIARRDRDQAAVPARLRTRGGGRRCGRAGAPSHLRDCRRRRHRRGDGRRDRRSGAPHLAARLPPHRSAQFAHRAHRSGATPAAGVFHSPIGLCRPFAWPHGRRGRARPQGDRLRCPRSFAGRRPHRGGDSDLGRGRDRLAGGNVDRRRARSRRAHQGERRSRAFPAARKSSPSAIRRPSSTAKAARFPASRRRPSRWAATSARVIAARVQGRPPPPPFAYRHLGDLATIGRKSAVVKLGPVQLTGFIGWLFWSAVHIYFLIGLRNRFVVALNWLWSYVTFQRGARLIGAASR